MKIQYLANGQPGALTFPAAFTTFCRPTDLAEIVASAHWKDRRYDASPAITRIHLRNVDGQDMGEFEVRCESRPVYTAAPIGQPKKVGPGE